MLKKYFAVSAFLLLVGLTLSACDSPEPVEPEIEVADVADGDWSSDGYGEAENDVVEASDEAGVSEGTWTLDSDASTLTWSASRIASSAHTGTVDIASGSLVADESGFVGGEFVMDMASISEANDNEGFLKHVKSDDFFGVETFPEATFVITDLNDQGNGEFEVVGDLTIRGITNEIQFTAETQGDANRLAMSAEFEIDRTLWDIKFDSSSFVQNLGDKAIKDEIGFELGLAFEL